VAGRGPAGGLAFPAGEGSVAKGEGYVAAPEAVPEKG